MIKNGLWIEQEYSGIYQNAVRSNRNQQWTCVWKGNTLRE